VESELEWQSGMCFKWNGYVYRYLSFGLATDGLAEGPVSKIVMNIFVLLLLLVIRRVLFADALTQHPTI